MKITASKPTEFSFNSIGFPRVRQRIFQQQLWYEKLPQPDSAGLVLRRLVRHGRTTRYLWQPVTCSDISYKCYVNTYSMTEMDENWIRLKDFAASPLTAVNFAGAPEGAVITVMNGDDVIEARKMVSSTPLKAGSYTYSVSAFGYKSIENVPFTVDGSKDSDTDCRFHGRNGEGYF